MLTKFITKYVRILKLVLASLLLCTACSAQLGEASTKIIVKLLAPIEVNSLGILVNNESYSQQDVEALNLIARETGGLFIPSFSQIKEGLNSNGELSNYLTLTYLHIKKPSEIEQLLSDLLQLNIVEEAYLAPQGEDAGMSLPQ